MDHELTSHPIAEDALASVRSELERVARVATFGAVIAAVAHEVNQPLSGILMNADTCLRKLGADPPNLEGARETVRRTIRDARRASDVIVRLRALFGKGESVRSDVDLGAATQEVIALSEGELRRAGVVLHADLHGRLPPVRGDRIQLQQVVLNLLLNALQAMREVEDRPRHLAVRTACDGDEAVCLTVQDTGTGFEPGAESRLFEPFYSTKPGGLGLGLSVSRTIVEAHGGRLTAQRNDGPGVTFSIRLPLAPGRAS